MSEIKDPSQLTDEEWLALVHEGPCCSDQESNEKCTTDKDKKD